MAGDRGYRDRYGEPLGTTAARAAECYGAGVDRLLAMAADDEVPLVEALELDPDFALAHAALALIHLGQGRGDDARRGIARARELVEGASERERGHIAAVSSLIEDSPERALAVVGEHVARFPREPLLLYRAAHLIHFGGERDRREREHALLAAVAPAFEDDWWFPGFYGFVCQEVGLLAEAERMADRALLGNPHGAWGAHAFAHVRYEGGDHTAAAAFLSGWLGTYDPRAPYHCHLSWHLALSHLLAGDTGAALTVYERDISPARHPTGYRLADSASLLWRCQLAGEAVSPSQWQEARARADAEAGNPGFAFADAHAALAWAGAHDETALAGQVDRLRALDATGHPLAGRVVLPAVLGIAAFARGDHAEAVRQMAPVAEEIVRIGGSNAQRDVFAETLAAAYLKAGREDQAADILRRRV